MDAPSSIWSQSQAALELPGPPTTDSELESQEQTYLTALKSVVQKLKHISESTQNKAGNRAEFLNTQAVLELIDGFESVVKNKDKAAAALSHPVIENSLPIRREVQSNLVQIVEILVSHILSYKNA